MNMPREEKTITLLCCNAHSSDLSYPDERFRVSHLSFSFFARYFSSESSILHNKGVSVIATTSDINNETINAIPSGISIRPSIPERKNRGRNATIIISVALRMDALHFF